MDQFSKKKNSNQKEVSPFAGDMILYIENHKEFTKKTELLNKFNKVSGYKIDT